MSESTEFMNNNVGSPLQYYILEQILSWSKSDYHLRQQILLYYVTVLRLNSSIWGLCILTLSIALCVLAILCLQNTSRLSHACTIIGYPINISLSLIVIIIVIVIIISITMIIIIQSPPPPHLLDCPPTVVWWGQHRPLCPRWGCPAWG